MRLGLYLSLKLSLTQDFIIVSVFFKELLILFLMCHQLLLFVRGVIISGVTCPFLFTHNYFFCLFVKSPAKSLYQVCSLELVLNGVKVFVLGTCSSLTD